MKGLEGLNERWAACLRLKLRQASHACAYGSGRQAYFCLCLPAVAGDGHTRTETKAGLLWYFFVSRLRFTPAGQAKPVSPPSGNKKVRTPANPDYQITTI